MGGNCRYCGKSLPQENDVMNEGVKNFCSRDCFDVWLYYSIRRMEDSMVDEDFVRDMVLRYKD